MEEAAAPPTDIQTHKLCVHISDITSDLHLDEKVVMHDEVYNKLLWSTLIITTFKMGVNVLVEDGEVAFDNVSIDSFPSRAIQAAVRWRIKEGRGIHVFKTSVHVFLSNVWNCDCVQWMCKPNNNYLPHSFYDTYREVLSLAPTDATLQALCAIFTDNLHYKDFLRSLQCRFDLSRSLITCQATTKAKILVFEFVVLSGCSIVPCSIISMSHDEFEDTKKLYPCFNDLVDLLCDEASVLTGE